MRWITYLDTFDTEWVHRAGRSHGNADGLSRQPPRRRCQNEECVDCGLDSDHSRSGGDSHRELVNLVTESPETQILNLSVIVKTVLTVVPELVLFLMTVKREKGLTY